MGFYLCPWKLGFKQSSFDHIARALRHSVVMHLQIGYRFPDMLRSPLAFTAR